MPWKMSQPRQRITLISFWVMWVICGSGIWVIGYPCVSSNGGKLIFTFGLFDPVQLEARFSANTTDTVELSTK